VPESLFNLQGCRIESVLERLGDDYERDTLPDGTIQYRYRSADPKYVVYLRVKAGTVVKVLMVEKNP
jgi:hypothetical protein